MRDQTERAVRLHVAVLGGAGLLGVAAACAWPERGAIFLAGFVLLSLGGSVWTFGRIKRQVQETLEAVDDTIRGLLDGREEQYFSPNADTLLGKFQSEIRALYALLLAGREREEALRQQMEGSLSHLVHQLNTPITNITLYSGFLLEEELTVEERRQFAQHIQAQADKVRFLGEGFAKIARLETGIITLTPVRQPLLAMVLSVIDELAAKAEGHGNTIKLLGCQHLMAQYDGRWTREALLNVLDNAVKYSHYGTVIAVEMTAFELYVRLSVTDEGLPLANGEYAQVFQRFYRGENVREMEGVGLGLYLAREILRGQGGYIKAGQTADGQTCFSLYLPR